MLEKRLLDPSAVARITGLELKARTIVEGFITGLHQSPYHGFSAEFSQHRPYMPGDPLRHLDYKVLGRTGRYYIKQYQDETNLKAYLLIDHSGSMGYGSTEVTKLDYAKTMCAALSLLLLRQHDAVGLVSFGQKLTGILPPKSATGWLEPMMKTLDQLKPSGETHVASALFDVAERVKRRGLVILLSDLLDDPDSVIAGMKAVRHVGHDLIVFHLMDKLELTFSFPRDARFRDLETGDVLPSRPWHIRDDYRREVQEFIDDYRYRCRTEQIDYKLFPTDTPYSVGLFEFLARRKRLM